MFIYDLVTLTLPFPHHLYPILHTPLDFFLQNTSRQVRISSERQNPYERSVIRDFVIGIRSYVTFGSGKKSMQLCCYCSNGKLEVIEMGRTGSWEEKLCGLVVSWTNWNPGNKLDFQKTISTYISLSPPLTST